MAVPERVICGCTRSVGAVCALFAALVSPLDAAIAILVVGVPVYLAANAGARRLMGIMAADG